MNHPFDADSVDYNETYLRFSRAIERCLYRLAIAFFVLLLLVQLLMQYAPVRRFLSAVEQLEGASDPAILSTELPDSKPSYHLASN